MDLEMLTQKEEQKVKSELRGLDKEDFPIYRLGSPMDAYCIHSCAKEGDKVYGQTLLGENETYQTRRILRASHPNEGEILIDAYSKPINVENVPEGLDDCHSIKRMLCRDLEKQLGNALEDNWKISSPNRQGVYFSLKKNDVEDFEEDIKPQTS